MAPKRSHIVLSSDDEQENIPPSNIIERSDEDTETYVKPVFKYPTVVTSNTASPKRAKKLHRARKIVDSDSDGLDTEIDAAPTALVSSSFRNAKRSHVGRHKRGKPRRARRVVDTSSDGETTDSEPYASSAAGPKPSNSISGAQRTGGNEIKPAGHDLKSTFRPSSARLTGSKSSIAERVVAPVDLVVDSEAELSDDEDSDSLLSDDEHDAKLSDEETQSESDASDDDLESTFQHTLESSHSVPTASYTFVAGLLWSFLSMTHPSLKNPIFAMMLSGAAMLVGVMSRYSLCFAPGLLQVIQSDKPPTMAFFKGLRIIWNDIWAVYVIVLEKQGHRWKIYIGNGTNADLGAKSRLKHYDSEKMRQLPRFVLQAIQDGYKITHKGLLCWMPIPQAGKYLLGRVLMYALEAWLSFTLWSMQSRIKDYAMPRVCPWSLDELEYDGLCSHSALHEYIPGESAELTLEQIAEKEVEKKRSRRAAKSAATIKWQKSVQERDPEGFAAKRRARDAPRLPQIAARSKVNKANNIATGKYRCTPCEKNFDSPSALQRHQKKQCHKDRAAGLPPKQTKNLGHQRYHAENKASKRFFCEPCQLAAVSQKDLNEHKKTARHLKKVASLSKIDSEESE